MTSFDWGSASWRDAAEAWGREQLRLLGRQPAGEMVDDSIQAWSAVWRIPTDDGAVLIKQTTPARAYEGEVTRFCGRSAPEQVTEPLVVDPTTARMLLGDGGTTLYSADHEHRGLKLDSVMSVVCDYGRLQRSTEASDGGQDSLPHWDPSAAGDDAVGQADLLRRLPDDDPRHIDDEQYASIVALRAELNRHGTALASSPIPNAVDQGDLWPGNILPPRDCGGYRFIDFGDAAWTHPFLSIRMLILECQYRWSVPEIDDTFNLDHPILRAVIDRYLRSWCEFADLASLRTVLYDALRLAPLRRSRAWITNLDGADDPTVAELGYLPWSWLSDVTVPLHVGGQ